MNIVFFCDEYPPRPHGGIGTFVETLAQGMRGRGHSVTIVGLSQSNERSEADGVALLNVKRSSLRFIGNFITRLRLRSFLSSLAKSGRADIIEVPDYMGMIPFGVPNSKVVVRLHLSATAIRRHAQKPTSRGIAYFEKRTLATNSDWIAVSQAILGLTESTFSLARRHAQVIYNPAPSVPANLPELEQMPMDYILYAGQVSKRKGVLVAAEAARDLMAQRPNLHLVYAGGPGPLHDGRPIEEEVLEILGPELSARVHFLGHVSRETVLSCMKRARVFVFPSSLEALGLVVLEAMNCGTPVVCTKIPPGPEMVEDNTNGLLADPHSPADFRDKIARILDDSKLAIRLSTNARNTVAERFSVEACIQATEEFYQECLARK